MKFLITGAGGQLGKEWVDFCEREEIEYSAFSSSDLDISISDQLENVLSDACPDTVINCAAYTKVDDAEDNKLLAMKINARAVKHLAGICAAKQIKLVHYSTDYVFPGESQDRESFPEGYPEDHVTGPINVYGYTKLEGEKAVVQSGCDSLIIRVSWLCGKYGNNFVKTMLKLASERDELKVVNDQFGSPSFTESVVSNTLVLINEDKKGIYHLTSNGLISWYEFASEIFKEKGIDITITPVDSAAFPTKAKRPRFSKLSTQKISTIQGIKLRSWQEGIRKLLTQID